MWLEIKSNMSPAYIQYLMDEYKKQDYISVDAVRSMIYVGGYDKKTVKLFNSLCEVAFEQARIEVKKEETLIAQYIRELNIYNNFFGWPIDDIRIQDFFATKETLISIKTPPILFGS